MSSPTNANQTQAERYAQAVVQAMVERWQGTLTEADKTVRNSGELASTLGDSGRSVDERYGALQSAMDGNVSPEAENLLKLLIQEGDVEAMTDVADALASVTSGRSGPSRVEITSAVPLTDEEKQQLQKKLAEQHGEGLTYDYRVNEALMGGLRIRIGDRLTDTSVATRLAAMRETLTSAVA